MSIGKKIISNPSFRVDRNLRLHPKSCITFSSFLLYGKLEEGFPDPARMQKQINSALKLRLVEHPDGDYGEVGRFIYSKLKQLGSILCFRPKEIY